jgi:hypothetical protein
LAGAAFFTAALVEAPLVAATVRAEARVPGASVIWSSTSSWNFAAMSSSPV